MARLEVLNRLAERIAAIHRTHPTRVAVDGVDGVGKTTLADDLVQPLRSIVRHVIRASIDGFHNPGSVRLTRGSLSGEGYFLDSFNYAALRLQLLDPLGPNRNREYRTQVFDYRTDSEAPSIIHRASEDAILLFDGVFLLRPELQDVWDFAIWVEAPFDVTVQRAVLHCGMRARASGRCDCSQR